MMNPTITYYKLALTMVPGVGPKRFRQLLDQDIELEEYFKLPLKKLKKIEGIRELIAEGLSSFCLHDRVHQEISYCEKQGIRMLFVDEDEYPTQLKKCADAPSVLFAKGQGLLPPERCLSVIGTRSASEYGKRITEEIIHELKSYNVTIVSGLAYGIDAYAHKAALQHNMSTWGVVAHGLHTIYPPAHNTLAKEMQQNGGLLSEYLHDVHIEKTHFPTRNRIVAGISQATLVIETDTKGGSMITAELAHGYKRDIFCVPGRLGDRKSSGCNELIRSLKGQLVTSADDIATVLGWKKINTKKHRQIPLFVHLSPDEESIVNYLKQQAQPTHIDEVLAQTQLGHTRLAGALLSLEMQQIIKTLPGKLLSLPE